MLLSSAGDPSLIAPARPSKLAGLAGVGCSARPTAVCDTTVFCRTRSRQRCSVGTPAWSLAVTLLCGSCVVMRQQGNVGGGVGVWWNTTMRSDKSANSSSLLGLLRGDAIHGLD